MKIRIKGNSIRYRLSKTDVERFIKTGYLEEIVDFGNQKLIYALKIHQELTVTASFEQNKIIVHLSQLMATEWETTDKIGFSGVDNKLSLLIEKDFQCLDNTIEDQADNYPNPALVC
ncbi:DUF7009 family protein [Mucilaginibacter calamicampi]|uniref:DUF7009 family protein n=1 Tax=Mucilaginibacter calamicampi TaxID=1302352 RepID=A0ABW2YUK4_9SPHI